MPVTIPEVEPIVPTERSLEAQVPPPASVKAVVEPADTISKPEIADGSGLTVTVVVYTVAGLHPLPVLLSVSE